MTDTEQLTSATETPIPDASATDGSVDDTDTEPAATATEDGATFTTPPGKPPKTNPLAP